MPKADEQRLPSLAEMEALILRQPDSPERQSLLLRLAKLQQDADQHELIRRLIADLHESDGLAPSPFPQDYPEE